MVTERIVAVSSSHQCPIGDFPMRNETSVYERPFFIDSPPSYEVIPDQSGHYWLSEDGVLIGKFFTQDNANRVKDLLEGNDYGQLIIAKPHDNFKSACTFGFYFCVLCFSVIFMLITFVIFLTKIGK